MRLNAKPLIQKVRNTFNIALPILALFFVFAVPSGSAGLYDGLPWSNSLESVTLVIVLPLFFVLGGAGFLQKKKVVAVLGILSVVKLLMCVAIPQYGWSVKMFPTASDLKDGVWVETYSTPWNPGVSDILDRAWKRKENFPLEWAMKEIVRSRWDGLPTQWANRFSEIPPIDDYTDAKPWIEVSGYVRVLPGHHFAVLAEGSKGSGLAAIGSSGEKRLVKVFQSPAEMDNAVMQDLLGEGVWSIKGTLKFDGGEWSLIPTLWNSRGDAKPVLPGSFLFMEKNDANLPVIALQLYGMVNHFISFGLIAFIAFWGIGVWKHLRSEGTLTAPVVISSCACILLPYLIYPVSKLITTANMLIASAGLAVLLSGISYTIWIHYRNPTRLKLLARTERVMMILVGPGLLLYFAFIWRGDLNSIQLWSTGDDWTAFQSYAYQIVAWREYLVAGESVFYHQPGYRYIVAFLHWLFGKSAFAQQMLDIWFILGGMALLSLLSTKMRISSFAIVLLSLAILTSIFVGPLRHHVGRGLSEFAAMFFMLWCIVLAYQTRGRHWARVIFVALIGTVAYWLRQDHLPAIAAIGFLFSETSVGTVRTVWAQLIYSVRVNWKKYLIYWGILILGVAVLVVRNWLTSGEFGMELNTPNSVFNEKCCDAEGKPYPIQWQPQYYLRKVWLILSMSQWGELPYVFSALMFVGVLMGLIACVYRPASLSSYPLAFGLVFVGILIPYYFFNITGYHPRFSIHVLPIGTLSFFLVFDKFLQNNHQSHTLERI